MGFLRGWGYSEAKAHMAPEVFLPGQKVSLGNLELAHLPKPLESPILDDMESTKLGL